MAIDYSNLALPKGEPRKRVKARKQRAERAVKQSVRAACVERDGLCRVTKKLWRFVDTYHPTANLVEWRCGGIASEWAHLAGHRRSQTRGQAPERRHTTKHSLILCTRHHAMEESGQLRVVYLSARGCDGPLRFEVKG
jgi:hypothetical protein